MVCSAYGAPLVQKEFPQVALKKGQVRIKTAYAGINYADILACKGKYQERSKPPFTPGLEVSGVVSECCECQSLSKGDRVFCIFSANGGFSEECVVDESRCFTVPKSVPLKSMSILGINYCTASLGLEIAAKMAPGEVVTVTGAAGGTGLAATELSLSRHHPTVCVVRGDRQRSFLEELLSREYPEGRFTVVDSEATPVFKEEIKAKYGGSDVVFDTVGTAAVFNENLLRSVRIQSIPANHLLVKNVSAMGIYLGGYLKNRPRVVQQCVESLCERVEKKELHPHLYEAFPLERANEAMEVMEKKKVFGKVILLRKAPEVIVFEDPDAKVRQHSRVNPRGEDKEKNSKKKKMESGFNVKDHYDEIKAFSKSALNGKEKRRYELELLGAITHTKRQENVKTFQMYKERRAKKQRKAKRELKVNGIVTAVEKKPQKKREVGEASVLTQPGTYKDGVLYVNPKLLA
ncbi:hypothetical protein WA577_007865 [Blastocystis sp. JDR]